MSEYLVIACGIATNLAAVIICLTDREKPLSPRKLWRAICKDQGIDPIRLQLALHPVDYSRLPQGGGARDPLRHGSGIVPEKCQRQSPSATLTPGHGRDVTP
jgi:N-glycosylase/DNA lyase